MATLTTLNAASPLDASDNSYLSFTADVSEALSRALDNVDADFKSMNTLTYNVEYSLNVPTTLDDDVYTLQIRIINGATILAAANSGGNRETIATNVTNTTDTNSGAVAFTYVNPTATKADWDGASVELYQSYSKTKGGDGNNLQVDHVIIDGTYDRAVTVTATQQSYTLTHQTADLTRALVMPADQASYTLTHQTANLTRALDVNITQANYTVTAQDAALTVIMPADQQSYTVTGPNTTLTRDLVMPAVQASYTVTGPNSRLLRSLPLVADQQSYTLTHQDTTFTEVTLVYLRPNVDKSIGSWTDQAGGTTNIYTAIDEESPANDSDYIKSESYPLSSIYQAELTNPAVLPDTSSTHSVNYRYGKLSANSQRVDITVRLREGAGTIASWTHADVPAGFTTANQTLTAPQVASIVSYDQVYVEIEANQVI